MTPNLVQSSNHVSQDQILADKLVTQINKLFQNPSLYTVKTVKQGLNYTKIDVTKLLLNAGMLDSKKRVPT